MFFANRPKLLILNSLFAILGLLLSFQASAFLGPAANCTPPSGCSGSFSVDSSRNVGFGTSNPTPSGTFNSTSTESGSQSFGNNFMVASNTNPGIGLKNLSGSGNTYIWSSRNFGNFQLYREGSGLPGYVVVDINKFGDIGIGTSSPSGGAAGIRLNVSGGDVKVSAGSFNGSGQNLGNISASNVIAGSFAASPYAFPAALAVGTTTTTGLPTNGLYVGGNVGIGTTAPGEKLTVTGGNLSVTSGNLHTNRGRLAFSNTATDPNHTIYNNYANLDNEGSWDGMKMNVYAGLNVRVGNANGFTPTSVLYVSSSGNVGIGTTSPTANKLVVSGASGVTDSGISILDQNGASAVDVMGGNGRGYIGLNNGGTRNIIFNSYTGAASYINNGGNVGIATTTPAYTLDVVGTGRFTGQLTVPTPTANTSAATKGYVDSVVGGGSGAGSFSTLTVSGTSTLATNANDRVGIGTASPGHKLSVISGTAIDGIEISAQAPKLYFTDQNGGEQSGEIAYNNGQFDFMNSTSRMTIQGGGNIGIGTANPGAKLEVAGLTTGGSFKFTNAGSLGSRIIFNTQGAEIANNGGSNELMQFNVPSNGSFYFNNNNTAQVTINSSGNVGVGTTTPMSGYKLHVSGSLYVEGGTILLATCGNNITSGGVYFPCGDYSFTSYSGVTTYPMIIKGGSSGNVGIATTTPSYKLDVVGTGQFSQPVIVGTPTVNSHAATKSYVDSAVGGGGAGSFTTLTSTVTTTLATSGGNVGIGTTAPANKLSVVGNTLIQGNFYLGGTGDGANDWIDYNGNSDNHFRFLRDGGAAAAIKTGGLVISGTYGGFTAPTFGAYIEGNVGIGTSTPVSLLNINSSADNGNPTLTISGGTGSGSNLGQISFYSNSGSVEVAKIQSIRDTANNKGTLGLFTSDGTLTERIRIANTGNVGIGTTTPAYKLDVAGTMRATGDTVVGNLGVSKRLYFQPTASDFRIYNPDGGTMWFNPSSESDIQMVGSSFIIKTTGLVGIGTVSPGSLLDVAGNAKIRGTIILNKSTDATALLGYVGAGGDIQAPAGFYDTLEINGNGSVVLNASPTNAWRTDIFIASSTGNVGIATTAPSYKLDVVGTAQFSQPVIVGTPTANSHAATKSYVDSAVGGGGAGSFTTLAVSGTSTLSGNLSFGGNLVTNLSVNGNNITGVNKISVTTIDPLYRIEGKNYATYAASIAGGVKEEYVGKAKLAASTNPTNLSYQTYVYTIDFAKVKEGSDLWLWRKAVDFSDDTVQVIATPVKTPVPVAYEIKGNKIIFRADLSNKTNKSSPSEIEFSYRLVGNRFDWRNWPTQVETDEKPGFILDQ